RAEIAASADDGIRQVKVPRASTLVPRDGFDAPLEWKVASPETTGDFSATCYYFARELKKTYDWPIGLIVAAWGGSKIEPWMSNEALRKVGGYEDALKIGEQYQHDESLAAKNWGDHWKEWWLSQGALTQGFKPWSGERQLEGPWTLAPDELTPWESWGVPA